MDFKQLLGSRKVWLAIIAVVNTIVGPRVGLTTTEMMVIDGLLVALMTSMAIVDHGQGVKTVAAGGDVTVEAPKEGGK